MKSAWINIFHIAFVAPLLAYVAYSGTDEKLSMNLVTLLYVIAAIVLVYHAYQARNKLFVTIDDEKKTE